MSVRYEFISLFVPVQVLREIYGIRAKNAYPSEEWRSDGKLIRIGAMSGRDIRSHIERFERLGLIGLQEHDGKKSWKDYCIVDELMGLDYPCDWIELDEKNHQASLIEEKLPAKRTRPVKR